MYGRDKLLRIEASKLSLISSVHDSKILMKVPILVIFLLRYGVMVSITDSGSVGEDSNSSTSTCDLVKYVPVKF